MSTTQADQTRAFEKQTAETKRTFEELIELMAEDLGKRLKNPKKNCGHGLILPFGRDARGFPRIGVMPWTLATALASRLGSNPAAIDPSYLETNDCLLWEERQMLAAYMSLELGLCTDEIYSAIRKLKTMKSPTRGANR